MHRPGLDRDPELTALKREIADLAHDLGKRAALRAEAAGERAEEVATRRGLAWAAGLPALCRHPTCRGHGLCLTRGQPCWRAHPQALLAYALHHWSQGTGHAWLVRQLVEADPTPAFFLARVGQGEGGEPSRRDHPSGRTSRRPSSGPAVHPVPARDEGKSS